MVQRLAVEKVPGLGKSLFPTIREFLSFSALLGYSEGRRIPLDGDAGIEDIGGGVYEHHDAMEIIFALAIAETESSDILKGSWKLSPAYDIAYSYNPRGAWTRDHQMSLAGKRNDFSHEDLLTFGSNAGLKVAQAT